MFYKTDNTVLPAGEPAEGDAPKSGAAETAQSFNVGTAVLFGCIGLALGGALGAIIAVLVNKKKKKTEA